jgi:hypothetical protein
MFEHHQTHLGQAKGQVDKKGTLHYFALPAITTVHPEKTLAYGIPFAQLFLSSSLSQFTSSQ